MGRVSRLGNELYEGRVSIDFIGRKWLWYAMSGLIVLLAVVGLSTKGLDLGIEFTGGAEYRVTLSADQATQSQADQLREAVAATGVESASSPVVTTAGSEAIVIQTEPVTDAESATIVEAILATTKASPDDLSQTELGASWGEEIAKRSLIGLAVFLVLVSLFIWAYFREWKMSVAALVALVHDVVITIGVYALTGFEVTPATVTGVLTILGFSLYDTVVVFDKVRENTRAMARTRQTYAEAANLAVNQTLVRSINTSLVAIIPVAAILYVGVFQLGSGSLKDLALALFVGMIAGVYSSIFIATPLLVHLKSGEPGLKEVERRAMVKRRHDADRYASVPAYAEQMPLTDAPHDPENPSQLTDTADGADRDRPARPGQSGQPFQAPSGPRTKATEPGLGRTAPKPNGPVRPSASSRRVQPTRQTRSKRGRK